MHYLDEEHIEHNILKLVLYKHDVLGNDFKYLPEKVDYQITSIQKCQYIDPRNILKLLKKPNKLSKIKEIAILKNENWWLITFVQKEWDNLCFISAENVSDNDDEFLKLH